MVAVSTDALANRKDSIMTEQTVGHDLVEGKEPASHRHDAADVYCWRFEQSLRAGYSRVSADIIATHTDIDLHVACELLANGCTERLATLILR
jgi:hypothetical protein